MNMRIMISTRVACDIDVQGIIKCYSLLVDGLRKVVHVRVEHKGAVQG